MRLFEVHIDIARVLHRFLNSAFGDFVEDNALWVLETDSFFDVPGNSFSFTVGVGCEQDFIGFFCQLFYFLDNVLLSFGNFVVRNKAALDVDGFFIALWKITDMAD